MSVVFAIAMLFACMTSTNLEDDWACWREYDVSTGAYAGAECVLDNDGYHIEIRLPVGENEVSLVIE